MTRHALIEYLKYNLKAKKLHGVHSPFAYTFSEEVLYTDKYKQQELQLQAGITNGKYTELLSSIHNYYNCDAATILKHNTPLPLSNMVILADEKPGHWLQLFNQFLPHYQSTSVFIITDIHKTKRHTAKWKRVYTHPKVMMSIDVYGLGIIFFRKEFKDKQHLILKY